MIPHLDLKSITALAFGILMPVTPVLAHSQAASGTLTVERAATVNALRSMSFDGVGGSVDAVSSGAVTEAIVEVTGDPNRVYRITLPPSIEADTLGSVIDTFVLRSENSGDITRSLTGRTNALGSDRIHIGGRLRGVPGLVITGVKAAIPVNIDYE